MPMSPLLKATIQAAALASGSNIVAQILQARQKNETIPIIVAGYKIWPIASIISFILVRLEKRIVFLSSVGFLWGIYMSLVASPV